jgi:hypothetical protein
MHSGLDYMTLPVSKPLKVADVKIRISYIYKRRSKPTTGTVYSCSKEPKRAATPKVARRPLGIPHLDQAEEEAEGKEPLYTAAHTHKVAALTERAGRAI